MDQTGETAVMAQEPTEQISVPCKFITGIAGSGKSFTVRERATNDQKWGLLTSTTGIAAVNLSTMTLHSALGLRPDGVEDYFLSGKLTTQLHRIAREYRNLVIDEVSMLGGRELLDLLYRAATEVNNFKDLKWPFGIVLCGDFCQLPPIKQSWAFEAECWPQFAAGTERLTKNWRQGEGDFLKALNFLRSGNGIDGAQVLSPIAHFDKGLDPNFDGTVIFGRNDEVDRYNWLRYSKLKGEEFSYKSYRWGKQNGGWQNIPDVLKVKDGGENGSYVLVLANDTERDPMTKKPMFRWVNGDCGHIVGDRMVKLVRTGQTVEILPVERRVQQRAEPEEFSQQEIDEAMGPGNSLPDGSFWDEKNEVWVRGAVIYTPLRHAWGTTVHKCVVGSERIPTLNKGLIQLQSVSPNDITPFGKILNICSTEQPAVKITTARGYEIVCSEEHRWMTSTGLKVTSDLSIQDHIELSRTVPFPGDNAIAGEFAWWLGALVGDGNYTDVGDGTIHFSCVTDKELGVRYKAFVESSGLRCSWRKDQRGLHHSSKPFRAYLLSLGIDYVLAPSKKIPEAVWRSGPACWGPFLRGLFDTDGSVGKSFVVLTTASAQLAKEVQLMLLFMGMVSKRRIFHVRYKEGPSAYWQVFLPSAALDRFKSLIGFFNSRKAEKLERTKPNRCIVRFNGYDQIKTIENLNLVLPMYDVEIEAPHLLSFGAFMGHNSQGLTLDQVMIDLRNPFLGYPAMCYVAASRCRTAGGLHLVGNPEMLAKRCRIDPKVKSWL
jgi:hypothetical protein